MASTTWERIKEDVRVVFDRDPAARSTLEVVLTYPGRARALLLPASRTGSGSVTCKLAGPLHACSNLGRFFTGIDIHPGAPASAAASSSTTAWAS